MAFKTKPREDQLSFLAECHKCRGELTITNGRVDRHDCRQPQTIYATDEEVAEGQEVRSIILDRLAKAFDNR